MVEAVLLGFCMENLAAEKKTEFDLCLDSNIQKVKLEINNTVKGKKRANSDRLSGLILRSGLI